jgi:hypothetical protein
MGIYFFSRHKPDPKMIKDLGGAIITQVKGTIPGIRRFGDTIIFSEIILAENTDRVQEMREYSIPVDSVVVAVAPLYLQIEWLNAGIKSLLIPQTTRELNEEGNIIFSYTGLVQIKRITIDKEQWSGLPPTIEQKHTERSALHNNSREKLEEVLIVGDRPEDQQTASNH